MFKQSFLVLMLLSSSVQAAVVLDQHNFSWGETPWPIGADSEQKLAQTFTAGVSGALDHVVIVLACDSASTGPITVAVHEVGADGFPVASLGATSLDSAMLVSSGVVLQEFAMPPIAMIAGNDYALVISGTGSLLCTTRNGGGPMFHSSGVGAAFFDARPNPPGWVPLNDGLNDGYLPFWIYTDSSPDEPLFCQFRTGDGLPNAWVPNHVPLCGCVLDSVYLEHRCWFVMPEMVLWRVLPFPPGPGPQRARWTVLPLGESFSGLSILEYDPQGSFKSDIVEFPSNLAPGKPRSVRVRYQGHAESSEVLLYQSGPNGDFMIVFETLLSIPPSNQ